MFCLKRWIIPVLSVFMLWGSPAVAADVLTLEESLKIALERSPRVLMATSQERQSQAQLKEARSMLSPGFTLRGGADRTNIGQLGPLLEPATEANVSLIYNQVLGWAKETRLTLDQSELGLHLARLQQEADRQAVVTDVVSGYVGVLEAMSALKLSEIFARNSEEAVRITEDRLAVGTATEADLLAAKAAMARARQGVAVARDSVELAKDALFQTIGLEQSQRDAGADVTFQTLDELTNWFSVDESLDELLDRAMGSRVEVQQAEAALELARLGLEQFVAGTGPRAELTGTYAWKDDGPALSLSLSDRGVLGVVVNQSHMLDGTKLSSPDDVWQIGAQVTWNLSDGGATNSRKAQLTEQVKQAELRLSELRSALSMQLSNAYNEVVHALQELAVADQELLEARTRVQVIEQQVETGTATQIALWQAEGEEVRAQHGRTSALGRLLRAQTSLAVASGMPAADVVAALTSSSL